MASKGFSAPKEAMDMSLMDAESSSGEEADTTIVQKSGCRVVKIVGMTLASFGLVMAAAMVTSHAFTRPNNARIDQQGLVDFKDHTVHNGMTQRLQQPSEVPDRALDDSVAGKGGPSAPATITPTSAVTTVAPTSAAPTFPPIATLVPTPNSAATTKPTPTAAATKPTVVKGPIRWAAHPEYCFDVEAGKHESGTNLQLWTCNGTHKENREFIVPTQGEGPIRWTLHPQDCIDIAGGRTHNGNNIQMWVDDCSHKNMQFIMPSGGRGPLRWAAHPEKCVDIDGGKTGDATNVKLWDCEDSGEHPNQQFILPMVPSMSSEGGNGLGWRR